MNQVRASAERSWQRLGRILALLTLPGCGLVGGSQTDSESHFLACQDDADCAGTGARCSAGQCRTDDEAAFSPFEPQLLAEIAGDVAHLRQSGDYLYWTPPYGPDLRRVSKAGGEVVTVVPGAAAFTVTADAIYTQLLGDFSIRKHDLEGTELARTEPYNYCQELVAHADDVYCASGAGVARLSNMRDWTLLGASDAYTAIGAAVVGEYVYWNAAGLLRVPLGGGEVESISPTWGLSGLTTFGDSILFTEAAGGNPMLPVVVAFTEGRGFEPIGPGSALDLAVLEPWLYAVDAEGQELLRFAMPGLDTPTAANRTPLATNVEEVESDAGTLYFTEVTRSEQSASTRLFAVRRR